VIDEESGRFGGVESGLLHADLSPKPAYLALKELIDSWTTSGNGTTDDNGELFFRGFAGDYDVTVETVDGRSLEARIHINEQRESEIIISAP